MVRSVFEKQITYIDSSFYDASAWSLVHAYNLPYAEIKSSFAAGKRITSLAPPQVTGAVKSNYAYVMSNTDYNIHKAIYALQKSGVIVQSAFRPFTTIVNGANKKFGYGSMVISVQQQLISPDSLYKTVLSAGREANIDVYGIQSGYNAGGVDLGSGYVRTLQKPEVLLIIGTGVAASEAGFIWHLLDQRLQMPVTKIDILNISRANLSRYNTMIMVSGNYSLIDTITTNKIRTWVQAGNTLITIKGGTEWAIRNKFTREKLLAADTAKGIPPRRDFDMAVHIEGAKTLGGSIFRVDLDTTHPIGFGFTSRKVSVYKNGLTFLQPGSNAYSTVSQYTNDPLIGGYIHPTTLKKVKNSAAILVGSEGSGRVVLFSDDPNFRGTWYGTNKLFLNAIFYGNNINVPQVVAGQE
jgi:hypothetical protein